MSSPKEGCGVRITGIVERAFTTPTGSFGSLTLSWLEDGATKRKKMDIAAFKERVAMVKALGVGETVTITAGLEMEAVKNKAKEDVVVDGKTKWVPRVILRTVTVSDKPKPKESTWGDDPPAHTKTATSNLDEDWGA